MSAPAIASAEAKPRTQSLDSLAAPPADQAVNHPAAAREQSLREWRRAEKHVPDGVLETIVGQLAEAIGTLHASEMVHLSVRPENVFICVEADRISCRLAGLERARPFEATELVMAAADPLYAPPEAVGLNYHLPGPALCAWDWWGLGRVIQEVVLGRHVFAQIYDCDVHTASAAVRGRIENAVLERDAKGCRAGAVELMAPTSPRLTPLLRGLLTSARAERWTSDTVDRWLRRAPVKDFYDAARVESHFRWQGKPVAPADMVTVLTAPDAWSDASNQLLQPTVAGTFSHFLSRLQPPHPMWERIAGVLALGEDEPLRSSSPATRTEVLTALALLQLNGAPLRWRGRVFDASVMAVVIEQLGAGEGMRVLRVLASRYVALAIERVDGGAGRMLGELGRTATEAEAAARRHGFIGPNDTSIAEELFELALLPIATLRATRDELSTRFAGSDHASVQRILNAPPGFVDLVLSAWLAKHPERGGFYSAEEAARRRMQWLERRHRELVAAAAWHRLARAMKVAPLLYGPIGVFASVWGVVAILAVAARPGIVGVAAASGIVVLAAVLRLAGAQQSERKLREAGEEAGWTWRDDVGRARREANRSANGAAAEAIDADLGAVAEEMARLGRPCAPSTTQGGGAVFALGIAGWGMVLGALALSAWGFLNRPSGNSSFVAASSRPVALSEAAAEATPAALAVSAPASETPAQEEATGSPSPGGVRISWPYRRTEPAQRVNSRAEPASSRQTAAALAQGRRLRERYRVETIDTAVLLPVPTAVGTAVMVYDARTDSAGDVAYHLEYQPLHNTWLELGSTRRRGIFLAQ